MWNIRNVHVHRMITERMGGRRKYCWISNVESLVCYTYLHFVFVFEFLYQIYMANKDTIQYYCKQMFNLNRILLNPLTNGHKGY